jgi:hypothetical protein
VPESGKAPCQGDSAQRRLDGRNILRRDQPSIAQERQTEGMEAEREMYCGKALQLRLGKRDAVGIEGEIGIAPVNRPAVICLGDGGPIPAVAPAMRIEVEKPETVLRQKHLLIAEARMLGIEGGKVELSQDEEHTAARQQRFGAVQYAKLAALDIDLEKIDDTIGIHQGIEPPAVDRQGLADRKVPVVHRLAAVLVDAAAEHPPGYPQVGLSHHRRGADPGGNVEGPLLGAVPERAVEKRLFGKTRHRRAGADRVGLPCDELGMLFLVRLEPDQFRMPRIGRGQPEHAIPGADIDDGEHGAAQRRQHGVRNSAAVGQREIEGVQHRDPYSPDATRASGRDSAAGAAPTVKKRVSTVSRMRAQAERGRAADAGLAGSRAASSRRAVRSAAE